MVTGFLLDDMKAIGKITAEITMIKKNGIKGSSEYNKLDTPGITTLARGNRDEPTK